jgi:hypothetical protein
MSNSLGGGVAVSMLTWWVSPETVQLAEFTPDQKAADMRSLLELTCQVSQANDLMTW